MTQQTNSTANKQDSKQTAQHTNDTANKRFNTQQLFNSYTTRFALKYKFDECRWEVTGAYTIYG
jgi:hypothetical protein